MTDAAKQLLNQVLALPSQDREWVVAELLASSSWSDPAAMNDWLAPVHTDDDGRTTVQFGDGISGARLPTGVENVRAVYRKGSGGRD